MAERKNTSARDAHELVNKAVAGKLQAMSAASKPNGRKRKGLNPDDIKRVVRRIQGEQPWDKILKEEPAIDPKTLEAWKPEFYRLAGLPEGGERTIPPKMPDPKMLKK